MIKSLERSRKLFIFFLITYTTFCNNKKKGYAKN